MSVLPFLDVGLALLVVGLAAWTIAARNLFASVVGYVAYGLLLAFVWVRLYAPDVALTEAAVGSGVTGVLLITAGKRLGAASASDAGTPPGDEQSLALKLFVGALALLVAGALAAIILILPNPAPSLAPEAAAAADGHGAGLGNPITAVLISYRSFDTMLEKVVLILAVLGVWSVGADQSWGAAPAPLGRAGLAGPVMAGSFFAFPHAFAKPIILFIEAFMLLSIAVALPALVAGPPKGRSAP
jgi:uncharacterized MnhB-related membrane protein